MLKRGNSVWNGILFIVFVSFLFPWSVFATRIESFEIDDEMKLPFIKPKHIDLVEKLSRKTNPEGVRLASSQTLTRKNNRTVSNNLVSGTTYWLKDQGIKYKSVKDDASYPQKMATLDIYYNKSKHVNKTTIVFVHGGGWVRGDKENILKNERLVNYFINKGYVLACINFRLLMNEESPGATYKDQASDIAAAIKWLHENIEKYDGNPNEMVLFGYSSGAHLASLVALDERYLEGENLSPKILKGVIAMDVHAYDIPLALSKMRGSSLENKMPLLEKLFGSEQTTQKKASPVNYVEGASDKTAFLLISAGQKDGKNQTVSRDVSEEFKIRLREDGHHAVHVHFASRGHVSLVMQFGGQKDGVAKVMSRFLEKIE